MYPGPFWFNETKRAYQSWLQQGRQIQPPDPGLRKALTRELITAKQSQQPELKHAAVRVTKVDLPWRLCAFGFVEGAMALDVRATLRPMLELFPFASVTLIGRERAGVVPPKAIPDRSLARCRNAVPGAFDARRQHGL